MVFIIMVEMIFHNENFIFLCFVLDDVEMDIERLYEVLPQLSQIFRIVDKIGEGLSSH